MDDIVLLSLNPMHRRGHKSGALTVADVWSWDFVVAGSPLSAVIKRDVAGLLGWGDEAWQRQCLAKILLETSPDLPPNRIALYVCPECGDISCGAVTAAVSRDDHRIVWSDFRWERDWDGAPDDD